MQCLTLGVSGDHTLIAVINAQLMRLGIHGNPDRLCFTIGLYPQVALCSLAIEFSPVKILTGGAG